MSELAQSRTGPAWYVLPTTAPGFCRLAAAAGLFAHAVFVPISMAGMLIGIGVAFASLLALRLVNGPVWVRSPLDGPLLLFVGAALLSLLLAWPSVGPPVGWHEATLWRSVLSPLVILSGVEALAHGPGDPEAARRLSLRLLAVWGAAALVPSAIAWVQHYSGLDPLYALHLRHEPIRPPAPHDVGHFAAAGFFHWYQRLAHNLTPPLCLAAGIALWGGVSRALRRFFSLACVPIALAVVLTTARLAWIGLAGAAVVLALLFARRPSEAAPRSRLSAVLAVALVLAGGLSAALVLPGGRERMLSVTALKDNGDRLRIWGVCADMVKQHPLTGVGWANFPQRSQESWRRIDPEYPLKAWCHDSFFSAWAEGGPLLFAAMALYWALLARAFWRSIRSSDPLARGASAGALAGLFAMFLNALGHDIFYSSEAMFGLGFMLGIAAVLAGLGRKRPDAGTAA